MFGLGVAGTGPIGPNLAAFTPAVLFDAGQQGAWFEPVDITTVFQDSAGTVPGAIGQPIGRINSKAPGGYNAVQGTAAARPLLSASGVVTPDFVDDYLAITVPGGGWIGTLVMATNRGTAAYVVSVPAGAFSICTNLVSQLTRCYGGDTFRGMILRNGAMTQGEIEQTITYLISKGGGPRNYPTNNVSNGWRNLTHVTAFPLLELTTSTTFQSNWLGCIGMPTYPSVNCGQITNIVSAWSFCTGLKSFPPLDFHAVTIANNAFDGCTQLNYFPPDVFNTTLATNFTDTFRACALTRDSVDNILVSINNAGTSTGTLGIGGGTNSPPGPAGLVAKAALQARGWTVTTN